MKKKFAHVALGWLIIYITSYIVKGVVIHNSTDIKDFYLAYFSYLPTDKNLVIQDFILAITHIIFVTYIFSGYILDTIKENGVIIFTRTNKKERWILVEYIKILLNLISYYLIQFSLFYIYAILNDMHIIDTKEFVTTVILLFIVQVLSCYILILFSNTISLYSNAIYGYFTSIITFCINIMLISILFVSNKLYFSKFLPFSQHLITLNDLSFIDRDILLFSTKIESYTLMTNIIIYILVFILCIYVSFKKIKRLDIL